MQKCRAGNHEIKLLKLVEKGRIKKGEVTLCVVAHDDWCSFYKGQPCNCNPDIYLKEEKMNV